MDHWECDLCAIGIAAAGEPQRLVYVSTYGKAPGSFDYECELLDETDEQLSRTVATGVDVDFSELLEALETHLTTSRARVGTMTPAPRPLSRS